MKLMNITGLLLISLIAQFATKSHTEEIEGLNISVKEEKLKGIARTNAGNPNPTDSQLQLRTKNTAKIKELGLPTLDTLPVTEDTTKIKPRSSTTVAQRAIAVAITAVGGELQGSDPQLIKDVIKQFDAERYFTKAEKTFLNDPNPEKQQYINFAWRYECVHVLLWALKKHDQLQPPNEICNVPIEVGILRDTPLEDLLHKSGMRSMDEIMEMADLYYRYHWAAIELRLKGKTSDKINEGIIRERHYALNWLIRYMNQEWDSITTDT